MTRDLSKALRHARGTTRQGGPGKKEKGVMSKTYFLESQEVGMGQHIPK